MAGMPSGPTFATVCAPRISAMMRARALTRASAWSGEAGLSGPEILLGVDADRRLGRLHHRDGHAVLEEAELLEALRPLERGGRQAVEEVQGRAPVGVEAHVLVAHGAAPVAVERDAVL